MKHPPDILCIGSVLWDIIGRHDGPMAVGYDVPGRITRLPGGVAFNVASTLTRFGLRPSLLTAIGADPEGDELVAACAGLGIDTQHALRTPDLPTDSYMAIESDQGVVAAIADAASLERAGAAILTPLQTGGLAYVRDRWAGPVVLDGNLSGDLLAEIARGDLLAAADLRIVPASPGKASRLRQVMHMPNAVLYLNRQEAGLILNAEFAGSLEAANALIAQGAARVLITDGAQSICDVCPDQTHSCTPPALTARRVTGAGDTFMAAHIAAELAGHGRAFALEAAMQAAAAFVAGDDP